MALLSFVTSQNFEKLSVLLQWKLLVLAAIPVAVVYYLRRTKTTPGIDIKQYSHFPQPEEADPVRGHWPWIEKSAGLGDPRRAFGTFLNVENQ